MQPPPAPASNLLLGGDISMLTRIEELGGVYRDAGRARDALAVFMDHGCNCFRVRLFVDPPGEGGQIQDLPYAVALAKRIRQAGATLILDLHYSDNWADPGHQRKPAAWAALDFDALVAKVREYTAAVVAEFKAQNALPHMIQIGNENTGGFLAPDGLVWRKDRPAKQGWDAFVRLLKAGMEGVNTSLTEQERVKIMLHLHTGMRARATRTFIENMRQRDVQFDMLGLSFYPGQFKGANGSKAMELLRDNMHAVARDFGLDVMVAETAYPHCRWSKEAKGMVEDGPDADVGDAWPASRPGQRRYLSELLQVVKSVPDARGKGVLWWYPEGIPVTGLKVWHGGRMSLFDARGNALPALNAFKSAE